MINIMSQTDALAIKEILENFVLEAINREIFFWNETIPAISS